MMLLGWLGCSLIALVSVGVAAVTRHDHRRDAGLLVMAVAVGGLLLALGADVVAALWLLLVLPRCWGGPAAPRHVDAPRTAVGSQVAAGVLVGVLWGALVYLGYRVDWYALPAGGFEAQSATLGGRLLTDDLVLGLGLLLSTLALLAGVRGPRAASWTSAVGHDGRQEGPS
jgi:hypothetical protein